MTADGVRPVEARTPLAQELRRLRRSRGLSQRAMASALYLSAHSAVSDYESGRRVPPEDVITAYERHLGVTDSRLQRLRDLALQALAAQEEPPARSAVPRQLPLGAMPFVGRDTELQALTRLVHGTPIVVISGLGGIGKTALATRWSQMHEPEYPDGTLYCNLRGFDPAGPPRDPSAVLEGLLRALDVDPAAIPPTVDDRAAFFRSGLAARRMLIVLDNARDARQVRPLLPGPGASRVIVTSRSRLSGLTAREGAATLPLSGLTVTGSVELLTRGLAAPALDRANLHRVAGLCAYMPLALRIAAQRISRDRTGAGVVGELSDPGRRLSALEVADDDLCALRPVLWWSYTAMPAADQRMLRLLGLLDGPLVDPAASAALCGRDTSPAAASLADLGEWHLLDAAGDGYCVHDLVRLFARERAAIEETAESRTAAIQRYTGYYLQAAAQARSVLHPHLPPLRTDGGAPGHPAPPMASAADALAWFDRHHANLVAAVSLAHETGLYATAWQLATAMFGYLDVRKHWSDWIATHLLAISAAEKLGDDDALGRIWCNLGCAYRPQYRFAEALDCYRRARVAFRSVGWRLGEAKAAGNLGNLYQEMGRTADSVRHHQRALKIFRELDDDYGTALTLTNLGFAYCLAGRSAAAIEAQHEALDMFRRLGDVEGEGRALSHLGKAYARIGDHTAARRLHIEAISRLRAVGNRLDEAYALTDLFACEYALGRPRAALNHASAALALLAALGHPSARAYLLGQVAAVHQRLGHDTRARALRSEADRLRATVGDEQYEAARRAAPLLPAA